MLAAVVFLDVNGVDLEHPSEALYALTMGVAEGRIEKRAVAPELEAIAKSRG
jgi:prophage maintenance system killer protein